MQIPRAKVETEVADISEQQAGRNFHEGRK